MRSAERVDYMRDSNVINAKGYTIKVVPPSKHKSTLSKNDIEMDLRAVSAVRAALNKAKICKKPIAGYDVSAKKAYIEYADGVRKYVK